ncbi:MAG: GNAT family N-acetyltransferase [Pyrinomonadaceae bacterium]
MSDAKLQAGSQLEIGTDKIRNSQSAIRNSPLEPITLQGANVRLEPLSLAHLEQLCEVGLEPDLWRWTTTQLNNRDDMTAYVDTALREQQRGTALPFVTILKETGRVVGSTRFGNIDLDNRHLEIGWTWVGVPWQRTAVNPEAKYLMLRHAFETLSCIRVEFKTDSLNERSRRALLRIGAREEGTHRNHMIVHDGRYRHSVFYSVIDSEWPDVKAKLEKMLLG